MYSGDRRNEFYRLNIDEKAFLTLHGFQWVNSRNISGYKFDNNNLLLRLHNGSTYIFRDIIGKISFKLSTTIREDLIGKFLRKGVEYNFVGILVMDSDSTENDKDLLYFYVEDKNLNKTITNDKYQLFEITQVYKFNVSSDKTIVNFSFKINAILKITNSIYTIGTIKILEILETNFKDYTIVKVLTNNETNDAINYIESNYKGSYQYIFDKL